MSLPQLIAVLERAQILGHIGSGSVEGYLEHAHAHLAVASPGVETRWCDLGSGGGLPGLVVAVERPDLKLTLIDRSASRTAFLADAVRLLGLTSNVDVVTGDATELAHEERFRGVFDGALSRSFGAPAVTAECAIGFLARGGQLVVSEPPEADTERWPFHEVQALGYSGPELIEGPPRFARLVVATPPGPEVPRKWKQVTKKPLF